MHADSSFKRLRFERKDAEGRNVASLGCFETRELCTDLSAERKKKNRKQREREAKNMWGETVG